MSIIYWHNPTKEKEERASKAVLADEYYKEIVGGNTERTHRKETLQKVVCKECGTETSYLVKRVLSTYSAIIARGNYVPIMTDYLFVCGNPNCRATLAKVKLQKNQGSFKEI